VVAAPVQAFLVGLTRGFTRGALSAIIGALAVEVSAAASADGITHYDRRSADTDHDEAAGHQHGACEEEHLLQLRPDWPAAHVCLPMIPLRHHPHAKAFEFIRQPQWRVLSFGLDTFSVQITSCLRPTSSKQQ